MGVPEGVWRIVKEIMRHLLRRPVCGVVAAARTEDGRWLLIRRTDTGGWALVGGTLEWGETLRSCIERELWEEAGAKLIELGDIVGVYSHPSRDPRFHAVTTVVHAKVEEPVDADVNAMEIAEVKLFEESELPETMTHGMVDMVSDARAGVQRFE